MEVDWGVLVAMGGLAITVVGAVIARDRQLTNMIHRKAEETAATSTAGDDALHQRINRTRDEMHEHFVKRADLDGHLSRIEQRVSELRQDMKEERRETNQRLDAVLAAVRDRGNSN